MASMYRYNPLFLMAIAAITLLDCTTNAFQNPSQLVHAASCRRPSFVTRSAAVSDYDTQIASAEEVLYRTAETKAEDPELVLSALEDLEKLMRTKRKAEPKTAAAKVLENMDGTWRLLFTTGTKKTQEKYNTRINYFPIKAIQSFKVKETPMQIENGIYIGDFSLIKFFGTFEFDLIKSKLEFDFDEIVVLGIKVPLKKGEAAKVRLIEWTSSIVCLISYLFWLAVLFSDSYLLLFAGLI